MKGIIQPQDGQPWLQPLIESSHVSLGRDCDFSVPPSLQNARVGSSSLGTKSQRGCAHLSTN